MRDHQPLDERDKNILETQEKMRRLRKELDRQGVHREQTIRQNYEDDIARVQQKKKICTNWHDGEIDHMKDKKKQSLGIVPEIGADYSKTPGWEVSRGETNYRGQKELCQNLQCSDTNLGSSQVGITDSFLQHMEKEGERYWKENTRISQQLKNCEDSLKEKYERTTRKLVDPYPARDRYWLPSPSDSDKELKTLFYSPTSSPELTIEQVGEWENILGHLLEVLLFPIKVSNRKAAIWRGGPPIWPLRLLCSGMFLVIWYKLAMLFFELVHYALEFLPSPTEKESSQKKERAFKKRNQDASERTGIDWLNKIRGGVIAKCLPSLALEREEIFDSVDPIFLLIHLEKIRQIIEIERVVTEPDPKMKRSFGKVFGKVFQRFRDWIQPSPKRQFLAYFGLAIATIGSQFQVRTPLRSIQLIQQTNSLEELYGISEVEERNGSSRQIQVGDGVFTFTCLSEKVRKMDQLQDESKTEQVKTGPDQSKGRAEKTASKRAKVVRLADLPPLTSSDFDEMIDEIITESNHRSSFRIRVQ